MQKNIWYTERQVKRIMTEETKKVREAALILVNDIKTSFTMKKVSQAGGRRLVRIRRGKSKKASRYHVVSRPGEPPAVDTGKLRQSITYNLFLTNNNIVLRVGSSIGKRGSGVTRKYPRRLEFGFVGTDKLGRKVRQLPRPWLYPAYRRRKQQIITLLSKPI